MHLLRNLTPRDLYLLDVLAAHRVLTAPQAADLLFPSLDRAQRRLRELTDQGVLIRFRAHIQPGSLPWRYTLSHTGAVLAAAVGPDGPPGRPAHDRAVTRLARSRQLGHLLGVNGFFCALAADAGRTPGAGLAAWCSEQTTNKLLPDVDNVPFHERSTWSARYRVEPDGYGLWGDRGAEVGFVLEYDTGTETVGRLVEKLDGYDARKLGLVVLLYLPSAARETHLHRLARQPRRWPVATTAPDIVTASGHGLGGPVWMPLGATDLHRRRLIELATPTTTYAMWPSGVAEKSPLPARHLPFVG